MQTRINKLIEGITKGDQLSLARAITIVENDLPGAEAILNAEIHDKLGKIIGITGPPGAGKSTLTDALISHWIKENKRVAVIAVDPSSPFNFGALLGDRIRMSDFFTHSNVFIRSLSSRGSLGGLNPKIWEITEVIRKAPFDYIILETVGVGQSEVDIAGLADCTIVTLVPEAGDEIQTIKAGIMEIGDIYVINKSDRPGADTFYVKVKTLAHERSTQQHEAAVIKTIASQKEGVAELCNAIDEFLNLKLPQSFRKNVLLTEKIWHYIVQKRMKDLNKQEILNIVEQHINDKKLNWISLAESIANR